MKMPALLHGKQASNLPFRRPLTLVDGWVHALPLLLPAILLLPAV